MSKKSSYLNTYQKRATPNTTTWAKSLENWTNISRSSRINFCVII